MPNSNHFDVVIIGGGAIGASCALELAKRNKRVALVEKKSIAAGASGRSAAMLECQLDAMRGDLFLSIAKPSLHLFPDLYAEVKSETGIDFDYRRSGILEVAESDEDAVHLQNKSIRLEYWGWDTVWIPREELINRYPFLNPDLRGAVLHREDGQVHGQKFTEGMMALAEKNNATRFENFPITNITTKGQRVISVKGPAGEIAADQFILAAGAWSDEILKTIGIQIGVFPVRGQLAYISTPAPLTPVPIYTPSRHYITPQADGTTFFGSTIENVGFNESPTEEAKIEMTKRATRIIPGISSWVTEKMTAAVRPGTQNEIPILGPLLEYPNFVMATGHYRNGILLAPITGKIIGNILDGTPSTIDLAPFAPPRSKTPLISS